MWNTILALSLLALLAFGYFIIHRFKNSATRKVVKLSAKRKDANRKSHSQICSFCRKKAGRLVFYADPSGKVVGVCRQCKPLAEKRVLTRL